MRRAGWWATGVAGVVGLCLVAAPASADGLGQFESLIKPKLPPGSLTYKGAAPQGANGFVLRDVVVTLPPEDGKPQPPVAIGAVTVEDLDFTNLAKDEPPDFARLKLEAIKVTPDSVPGFDLKPLGNILLADLILDYRAEPAKETFTLNRLELVLRGLGRLEATLVLDGITPAAASDPAGAKDNTSLRSASFTYEDGSLLAKLIPVLAADDKGKGNPAELVEGTLALLEMLKDGQDQSTQGALTVVASFLRDWKQPKGPLRVTLDPPERKTGADLDSLTPDSLGLAVSYGGVRAGRAGR